jgi:succinate dehydrogenase / fumarate reductase cytochrome b subunit
VLRIVLLASVGVHMFSALQLYLRSNAARDVGYRRQQSLSFTYASRTMRWGGVIIIAFVAYHLLHFTIGNAHPRFVQGDVYSNLVIGFQSVPVALAYAVAVGALGLHLYHGLWSALQTVGASHPKYNHLRRPLALGVTLIIVVGFLSVPAAVLMGVLS